MQGKTIVVTGGLGALGSVIAETAAKQGASVALIDHARPLPKASLNSSSRTHSSLAASI